MNNSEFHAQTENINRQVQRVSEIQNEDARAAALDLLQSVMDLHGAVISRVVEVLSGSGDAGRNSLAKLGSDPLICGLLVLYGVHPLPLEERVGRAVEKASQQLRKQGGGVTLTGIADAVVKVKIEGSGHGCGSSGDAFKRTVEQAVLEAAPDVLEVIVDGVPASAQDFVPVNSIQPAKKEENKYEESAA
jgi:Fe-S cluster biogenesis protein NfuA